MVDPGILPFTLIRGIDFTEVILQCRDQGVLVTGTLNPDVTGTYTFNGYFNNYPLFILTGNPCTFIYLNPIANTYLIARTLTTGGLTDYWILPAATEPTGTYTPVGAVTGTATATDNPVDLTGITPQAVVRRTTTTEIVLDLMPIVTDALGGEITIPEIPAATTNVIPFTGNFNWDLVLLDNISGERFGPYVKGPFKIVDNITQLT